MGYRGRVRVRSCGVLTKDNHILLVRLNAPTQKDPFWTVPGGGVQFLEPLQTTAEREVQEETGITVKAHRLLGVSEFIRAPFHAMEYFWSCEYLSGDIKVGTDPELGDRQIIMEVAWVSLSDFSNYETRPTFLYKLIENYQSQSGIPIFHTR